MREITSQVEENSSKLETQNSYFKKVFDYLNEMSELLTASVNAVEAMGNAHSKQNDVIEHTVQINSEMADSTQCKQPL